MAMTDLRTRLPRRLGPILAGPRVTLVSLVLLMVLVTLCTLAQPGVGVHAAVRTYMRSLLVWGRVPGLRFQLPLFPGGILVGLALVANLSASLVWRLGFAWHRAGLWIAHAGLVLLVGGEFAAGAFQEEAWMSLREGQTLAYTESPRELELALSDLTDPAQARESAFPASPLRRPGELALPGAPFSLRVVRPLEQADLEPGRAAAVVEPIRGGRSLGTLLVTAGPGAPRPFTWEGRTYTLGLRPRREYLPFSLALRRFDHEVYPGTDIPRSFSSLVHLSDPARGESRDVLIRMNQPLRYGGRTFYQASYGEGGRLSVLQVVRNPVRRLPYLACSLVALGLLLHFGRSLLRAVTSGRAA